MQTFFRNLILKRIEKYAQTLLHTHQPTVIAVTGSVGKTSTKLAIAHLLGNKYHVLVHEGNYNTEFGLPLSLFELEMPANSRDVKAWWRLLRTMKQRIASEYPYDVVILEMGADQPGDIGRFMRYIQPDIGVVTAVAKVHYAAFESIEQILEEKWQLALGSKTVVYNHDDKRLRTKAKFLHSCLGYSLDEAGDVWTQLDGFDFERGGWSGMLHAKDEQQEVFYPVLGQQSVYALVAATAVALKQRIPLSECVRHIADWQQPPGRMRLLAGKNGSRIIDDTYNSSPYAAVAALEALYQLDTGRKIAILGSMNELGEYEAEGHRLVGKHCDQLDGLATIGVAANTYLIPAALAAGLDEANVHECNTPYQAGDVVASQLQPGDTVLAKGSQNGVFAEEALKALLADPNDEQQLVRQSPEWVKRKQEQFQ